MKYKTLMVYNSKSKIESICQKVIKSVMVLILSYLTFSSIVKTYYYGLPNEIATVIYDDWIKNIASIGLVIIIFCLFWYLKSRVYILSGSRLDGLYKYTKIFLFILLAFSAQFWVFYSRINGVSMDDPYMCLTSAAEIRMGNYNSLQPGGYLNMCINNLGFVWFIRALMVIFDNNIVKGFYIINALSLPFFYFFLSRIVWSPNYHISKNLFISFVYFLGIIFTPLIYLCTRFYGNMLGLCFAAGAIFFEFQYFSSFRISDILLSAIFIFISIALKMNHVIFAIAMILFAIAKLVCFSSKHPLHPWKKYLLSVVYIVFLIVIAFASSKLIITFTEKVTGQSLNDAGYSYYSHIAMGLQDNGDINSPGWWNGYNDKTYYESGFSTSTHKQIAIESIKESLSSFCEKPSSILSFLERKINSQWNCPEFQMDCYTISLFVDSHPNYNSSNLAKHWTKCEQSEFLNLFHSAILFGSLLYLILFFHSDDDSTILLLTFLGGFIFHLVWEAKAVYALSYFVLLIPFAIIGYVALSKNIFSFICQRPILKMKLNAKLR